MSVVYPFPKETSSTYFGGYSGFQPDLSNNRTIHTVILQGNNLEELVASLLPPSIRHVNVSYNSISIGLPNIWPDTIETLNLNYNYIAHTDFVEHWPVSLRELSIDDNTLTACPRNLPDSLQSLSMIGCRLQTVYNLPPNLKHLRVNYNTIRILHPFPRNLLYANLSHNAIQSSKIFKYKLPPTLRVLQLNSNQLTWIPSVFPDTLETLNLSDNKLTEFTAKIPASLNLLQLHCNRIRIFRPSVVQNVNLVVYIQNNCLTDTLTQYTQSGVISTVYKGDNWNTVIHHTYAQMIQFAFAKYKLKRGVRTWARVYKVYQELFATAMHPSRLGQFEPLPSMSLSCP